MRERVSRLKSQFLSERRCLTKKKASTTIEDLINIHYIEKDPSKTRVPTSLPKQICCNQTIVRNSPSKFSNYSPKTTSQYKGSMTHYVATSENLTSNISNKTNTVLLSHPKPNNYSRKKEELHIPGYKILQIIPASPTCQIKRKIISAYKTKGPPQDTKDQYFDNQYYIYI